MTFFESYLGKQWPRDSHEVFGVAVQDVQRYRDWLISRKSARKTINRRICTLSAFYKYLSASAAELRLPIVVPNPAHSQFIPRQKSVPENETEALSPGEVRLLKSLPDLDGHNDLTTMRDRAIIYFYLYTAARIGSGCSVKVEDLRQTEQGTVVVLETKGDNRITLGVHEAAADVIWEYIAAAGITSGALFRPQAASRTRDRFKDKAFSEDVMWELLNRYLQRLPGAMKKKQVHVKDEDGNLVLNEKGKPTTEEVTTCIYSPHSIRATAATQLLVNGVDLIKVQNLLGHASIETTRGYYKAANRAKGSASHLIPY